MKPHISLITLGVADLQRSIVFYRDGLGLPMQPSNGNVAFFELRGTWLSLYPRKELAEDAKVSPEGDGFRAISIAHNEPSKEGVDAVMREAERAGARIVKAAENVFWGGYSGYFADPDGFLWEVAWNPHLPQLAGV